MLVRQVLLWGTRASFGRPSSFKKFRVSVARISCGCSSAVFSFRVSLIRIFFEKLFGDGFEFSLFGGCLGKFRGKCKPTPAPPGLAFGPCVLVSTLAAKTVASKHGPARAPPLTTKGGVKFIPPDAWQTHKPALLLFAFCPRHRWPATRICLPNRMGGAMASLEAFLQKVYAHTPPPMLSIPTAPLPHHKRRLAKLRLGCRQSFSRRPPHVFCKIT